MAAFLCHSRNCKAYLLLSWAAPRQHWSCGWCKARRKVVSIDEHHNSPRIRSLRSAKLQSSKMMPWTRHVCLLCALMLSTVINFGGFLSMGASRKPLSTPLYNGILEIVTRKFLARVFHLYLQFIQVDSSFCRVVKEEWVKNR